MRITNYEDLIMKRAMDVFAEDGLKFFGIDKKVKELGPTELVVLESKNLHMDYTFLMEDDTYIHFEFQTTNKNISDLRRFRAYEALLSHQTGKDVVTYVIYSSNIINVNDTLETGINKFKVNTISMASKNGDDVFKNVSDKISKGISLSKDDIISLSFSPIMGGQVSKLDRILNTIKLLKDKNVLTDKFANYLNSARLLRNRIGHRYKQPKIEVLIEFLEENNDIKKEFLLFIKGFMS